MGGIGETAKRNVLDKWRPHLGGAEIPQSRDELSEKAVTPFWRWLRRLCVIGIFIKILE